MNDATPRPPDGDWLGTPYLRLEREGPVAVVTVDRPEMRNAMSPAMYFGVRYAVDRVNADDELAGMLLTGRVLSASEAADWGLVARVVPHDDLLAEARDVLAWCCRTAPKARADVKRVMDQFYGAYDRMAMDASLSSDEPVEGFAAFKEHRNPSWVPEAMRSEGRI